MFGILFQTCISLNRTSQSNLSTCELHEKKLRKSIVKVFYGNGCPDFNLATYPNAKKNKCMGCVIMPPRKYFSITLTCRDCQKNKKNNRN